jgi:hypothetical protein
VVFTRAALDAFLGAPTETESTTAESANGADEEGEQ